MVPLTFCITVPTVVKLSSFLSSKADHLYQRVSTPERNSFVLFVLDTWNVHFLNDSSSIWCQGQHVSFWCFFHWVRLSMRSPLTAHKHRWDSTCSGSQMLHELRFLRHAQSCQIGVTESWTLTPELVMQVATGREVKFVTPSCPFRNTIRHLPPKVQHVGLRWTSHLLLVYETESTVICLYAEAKTRLIVTHRDYRDVNRFGSRISVFLILSGLVSLKNSATVDHSLRSGQLSRGSDLSGDSERRPQIFSTTLTLR